MKFLIDVDMEKELVSDWHKLQLERVAYLKEIALKAYYAKLRLYQYRRRKNLELGIA